MTDQGDNIYDSIDSLECPGTKNRHQGIPPISSFARAGDVTDDDFGSSGSNLYETNRNRNDTGSSLDSSNEAFTGNQGNHTPNVITVAQQLLGSVANFVSSSSESLVNSLTTTVPGSTAQNNWSFSSAPMTSVQNTAMAVQSPQLHAALTMSSLPSPNVSLHDAYTSLIHQQGITNSDQQHNQQTNFIPFSTTAIPIGIHTSNLTMNGQQNQIEVGNVRGSQSTGKVIVDMNKQPNVVNDINVTQHHPMSVSLVTNQGNFMNSSLPTAATVAPPNTQLLPTSSTHPHEEGNVGQLAIRTSGNSVSPSEQEIHIGITADGSDQDETDDTGNENSHRRQSKKGKRRTVPVDEKDDRYFERRKRNNQAAKRSRDARKVREEHVSRRADFLERENAILKAQLSTLREEANSLRQLLSQRPVMPAMIANHGHQMT